MISVFQSEQQSFGIPMNPPQKFGVTDAAKGKLGRDLNQALWRALRSQMHPRMIFALFLPFMVIMFVGVLLLWFGWGPVTDWLGQQVSDSSVPGMVDPVIGTTAFLAFKAWLIPIAAGFILLPLAGIAGLAVAAVWVMPLVLAHVGHRDYPDVQAKGHNATVVSVSNAVWVSLVFVVGWLMTLPLWLIPPLGLVLSVFWWTFAFTRLMRVDSLVEHATLEERRLLWRQRSSGYWSMGLGCALLNLIPPAWLFLPVFSGLFYAHYSFEALRQVRRDPQAQDV
jgi:hypothetical protein